MHYLKTHLNLVFAIGFLALVAIFFVTFYGLKFHKKASVDPLKVVKNEVDTGKLPELFPKEIPIEKGAKITQNYNATSEDGRFQATRTFETTKSLDANLKLYKDYFAKDKWVVQATIEGENYKMISATKDTHYIQVSIGSNTVAGTNTVDISLTTNKQ